MASPAGSRELPPLPARSVSSPVASFSEGETVKLGEAVRLGSGKNERLDLRTYGNRGDVAG